MKLLSEFIAKRSEQDRILRETIARRDGLLRQSETLETEFEENEFKLADLSGALDTRLGSLKELFGVLQQVAGDTSNEMSMMIHSSYENEQKDNNQDRNNLRDNNGNNRHNNNYRNQNNYNHNVKHAIFKGFMWAAFITLIIFAIAKCCCSKSKCGKNR